MRDGSSEIGNIVNISGQTTIHVTSNHCDNMNTVKIKYELQCHLKVDFNIVVLGITWPNCTKGTTICYGFIEEGPHGVPMEP
jgi:hypothetical protein